MEWNLKRVQKEVNEFAKHTRETLGTDTVSYTHLTLPTKRK